MIVLIGFFHPVGRLLCVVLRCFVLWVVSAEYENGNEREERRFKEFREVVQQSLFFDLMAFLQTGPHALALKPNLVQIVSSQSITLSGNNLVAIRSMTNSHSDVVVSSRAPRDRRLIYLLSILNCVNEEVDALQGLVVLPTRELASEVFRHCQSLMSTLSHRVRLWIGGTDVNRELDWMGENGGCHIAIGTVGRMKHILETGGVSCDNVRMLILDGVSRLLSGSFLGPCLELVAFLPNKSDEHVQFGVFDDSVIAEHFLTILGDRLDDPVTISTGTAAAAAGTGSTGYRDRSTERRRPERALSVVRRDQLTASGGIDFDEWGLRFELLRGIYAYGFERPSAIQEHAVPVLVSPKKPDMIAQSPSGTGKTAALAISMLQNVDESSDVVQGMVLVPNRFLALQIHRVFQALAEYTELKICCCIGGVRVRENIDALRKGCHIVVGTVGRLKHMVEGSFLKVDDLKMLIFDEADLLLSRGLKDQCYDLFRYLPHSIQIALFGTTIPDEAVEISQRFLRDPVNILLQPSCLIHDKIRQFSVDVQEEQYKFDTLVDLIQNLTIGQAIVFCNSKRRVDMLADQLGSNSVPVSWLHQDIESSAARLVLKEFRTGASRIMIATEAVLRGIDVHQVSLVVNYDLPAIVESYVHRIGRAGRYGRVGVAINFVTGRDSLIFREIQSFYGVQIAVLPKLEVVNEIL